MGVGLQSLGLGAPRGLSLLFVQARPHRRMQGFGLRAVRPMIAMLYRRATAALAVVIPIGFQVVVAIA